MRLEGITQSAWIRNYCRLVLKHYLFSKRTEECEFARGNLLFWEKLVAKCGKAFRFHSCPRLSNVRYAILDTLVGHDVILNNYFLYKTLRPRNLVFYNHTQTVARQWALFGISKDFMIQLYPNTIKNHHYRYNNI